VKFFNTFDFIENFFPNTPLAFLIFIFSFFLITTVFILVIAKILKKEKKTINNKQKELTIDNLVEIVKNKKSNINDLVFALEYFNDKFSVREFPDKAFEFFKMLLIHKSRSKILFDIFHNKTIPSNKDFKEQLNKIESEALNK
jgi:cbb3-type cytochrome oxidase subunit 3